METADFSIAQKISETNEFPRIRTPHEDLQKTLHIQPKYRKMRTRKNSGFGHFSRSVMFLIMTSSLIVKKQVSSHGRQRNLHFSFLMASTGSEHFLSLLNDIKGYYYCCYHITTYYFCHPFEIMLVK